MPLVASVAQIDPAGGVEVARESSHSSVAHKPAGSTDPESNGERWLIQELTDSCGMFDVKLRQ